MDAKSRNRSLRSLYLTGGKLDILLWGYAEMERQCGTSNKKKFDVGNDVIDECPCGCGLLNDICPDRVAKMKAQADEIPF
jgi:hypothetical protein